MICGFFNAIAAVMVSGRVTVAMPSVGDGLEMDAVAAVIIGEVLGDAILGKHMDFKGRLIFVVIGGKKKGDAVVRVIALRGKNRQIFTRVKG